MPWECQFVVAVVDFTIDTQKRAIHTAMWSIYQVTLNIFKVNFGMMMMTMTMIEMLNNAAPIC